MKRFLFFLTTLLAALSLNANPVEPTFSNSETDEATWYFIQFNRGNSYLLSQNAEGSNLVTGSVTIDGASCRWRLIGTRNNFYMKSQDGKYVYFASNHFKTTATAANKAQLKLSTTTVNADCWEIGLTATGERSQMNQEGGYGDGKNICGWETNDVNNALRFVATTPPEPDFSTEGGATTYYFLKFIKKGTYLQSDGAGRNVAIVATPENENTYKWAVVGTRNGFRLKNKDGNYGKLTGSGDNCFLQTTAAQGEASTFSLRSSTNGTYYLQAWQIYSTTKKTGALNNWQGGAAGKVGVWSSDDDEGNCIQFILETDMDFPEYEVTGTSTYSPTNKLTLWYDSPALIATTTNETWKEYALPLGNGELGTAFLGNVKKEHFYINEKSLWKGTPSDYYPSPGGDASGYQYFGDLYVENLNGNAFDNRVGYGAADYYRCLDLTNATGSVHFKSIQTDKAYDRTYFVSNPDKVAVYKFSAEEGQHLRFTYSSGHGEAVTYAASGTTATIAFSGSLETITQASKVKIVAPAGATVSAGTNYVDVATASAGDIVVFLAGMTNFSNDNAANGTYTTGQNAADLLNVLTTRLDAAAEKGWNALLSAHTTDYKNFFDRVDFDLAGTSNTETTRSLIDNYSSRKASGAAGALMLEQLYFAYGRYLTIAASRGMDLPSNLQGIWTSGNTSPWKADIHANINVQMNYWPAEPTNLSEMHLPFLNYIIKMAESPQWKSYIAVPALGSPAQTRGWTCFTENNIFGGVGTFKQEYAVANAWYVSHLWQHYRYTLDKTFLTRAFPAMVSATQFWLDRLVLADDGTYECPREYSPEHGPTQNATAHAQQIVTDLLESTLAADSILGNPGVLPAVDRILLRDRLSKIDRGLHKETYDGAWGNPFNTVATGESLLKEWKYSDYTAGAKNHRHPSHLMCLYPFNQVKPGTDMFNTAVNSLRHRGDGATGWSMAWKVNLWAHALDGNHARTILGNALSHSAGTSGVFYNLFDVHEPSYFQIDGNYGACSGITEMIMQGGSDTIRILPALPDAWPAGHMKGLKAAGNFTIDITWANSMPTEVVVTSNAGQHLALRYADIATHKIYLNGVETRNYKKVGSNIVFFASTNVNDVLTIKFNEPVEFEVEELSEGGSSSAEAGVTPLFPSATRPTAANISEVAADANNSTYTLSNNLLTANFHKAGGRLYLDNVPALDIVGATDLFKFTLYNGTTVKASNMTLANVELENLTKNASLSKASESMFNGKALKATYTYNFEAGKTLTVVWRAVLRDNSHYLRTTLDLSTTDNVKMSTVTPLLYTVSNAHGAPTKIGETNAGNIFTTDRIFIGVETPTAVTSVIGGNEFEVNSWRDTYFSQMDPDDVQAEWLTFTPCENGGTFSRNDFAAAEGKVVVSNSNNGNISFTFLYGTGNCGLPPIAVQLLNLDGTVAYQEAHANGFAGYQPRNNTFTLSNVADGTYFLRYVIETKSQSDITTSGTITVTGATVTNFEVGSWQASYFRQMNAADVKSEWLGFTPYEHGGAFTASDFSATQSPVKVSGSTGTVSFTFRYGSGNCGLTPIAVQLLNLDGTVVKEDAHVGFAGSATSNNTYTLTGVTNGTYILRYVIETKSQSNICTSGTINVSGATITKTSGLSITKDASSANGESKMQGVWRRPQTLAPGDDWHVGTVVGLIAQDTKANQTRRSVLSYIERERAVPWRSFSLYNSWFELNIDRTNKYHDYSHCMREAQCTEILQHWKDSLYTKRGTHIESYVWDDGWDTYGNWGFNEGFPNGFSNISNLAGTFHTNIGAWLGPKGGYDAAGAERKKYWSDQGKTMGLADPDYYQVFLNTCTNFLQNYNFNCFKFDGIREIAVNRDGPATTEAGLEDCEGILGIEAKLRKVKPDVFIYTTVGTWASPFWFNYTDAIWKQGNDWETVGAAPGDKREQWITYRDSMVHDLFVNHSPLTPINNLMTHGVIVTKYGSLNSNSGAAGMPLEYNGIVRELRAAYGCGSAMVELYMDKHLLDTIRGGKLWDRVAECVEWHKENADVLADVHWVGGAPWDGHQAHVYGWGAWTEKKSTLTLRNPTASPANFTFKLRDIFEIPDYVTEPYITFNDAFIDENQPTIENLAGCSIGIDDAVTITLPAFSVVVYNGRPDMTPVEHNVNFGPNVQAELGPYFSTNVGTGYVGTLSQADHDELFPTYLERVENSTQEEYTSFVQTTLQRVSSLTDGGHYRLINVGREGRRYMKVGDSGNGTTAEILAAKNITDADAGAMVSTVFTFKKNNGADTWKVSGEGLYLTEVHRNGGAGTHEVANADISQAAAVVIDFPSPGVARLCTQSTTDTYGFLHDNGFDNIVGWESATDASHWYIIPAETLTLSLKQAPSASYTTTCLPFPVSIQGTAAADHTTNFYILLSNATNTTLTLTRLDQPVLPAGTAALLRDADGATTLTLTIGSEGAVAAATGNVFIGRNVLTPVTTLGSGIDIYAFSTKENAPKFFPYTATQLAANKAFYAEPAGSTRVLAVEFGDEGEVTAIDNLFREAAGDDRLRDLSGRLVSGKAGRGVYILNGKKVYVK